MQKQNNENIIKPELPYQTLQFILTQTIATKTKDKNHQITDQHSFKDILIPHILQNHNSVLYILFHIPTIYNWLRKVPCKEASLLNQYILSQKQLKLENKTPIDKINFKLLLNKLEQYISKWQIVKLSLSCKVYINNIINVSNLDQKCLHLAKNQSYSSYLQYQISKKHLICKKAKCKQCKKDIEVQTQIRNYSNYLLLNNFYGQQFQIVTKSNSLFYQILILISETCIYIKSANNFWYQINLTANKSTPVGFHKINTNNIIITVYQKPNKNKLPLNLAQALSIAVKNQQKLQKNKQIEQIQQDYKDKYMDLSKSTSTIPKQRNQIKKHSKQEPIRQLTFEPIKILLKQENKRSAQYKKQVEQLYLKPKIKDQYQLDYDKGKLKKIKQKKTYIQPNFNQIYANNKKNIYLNKNPDINQPINNLKTKKIKKINKKKIDFQKQDYKEE